MTTWRRSNQICIEGIRSFKILQVLVNFHVLCFLVEAVCPLCRCVLCIFTLHWSTSVVLKGAWLKCWYLVWIECVCMYAVNIQVQITEWKKTLLMLLTASPPPPPVPLLSQNLSSPDLNPLSHRLLTQESSNCSSLAVVQSNNLLMQCDA